jgi:hypothetical protein
LATAETFPVLNEIKADSLISQLIRLKVKKTIAILVLTICSITLKGQSFYDSIIVLKNTYQNQVFPDIEELYRSDKIKVSSKRLISRLISYLTKFDEERQLLFKFGIDTNFIKNNPGEVLKLYDGYYAKSIVWNEKQREFIYEKLTDVHSIKSGLNEYLSKGCCYSMHNPYRFEFVIKLYSNNVIQNVYTSRKSTFGYQFPYIDKSGRYVYNYEIDRQLNILFKRKLKIDEPLNGNALLKYIVNQLVENNMRELYKLSAYSYNKEISELSSEFSIISTEEVYGRGRYIWDEPKTIKVSLKNKYMFPNVYLQFLDSQVGETLYSRDSIKKDYKEIVHRVQSISFITGYLKQDTTAHLDVYYFNNSGINQYNIEGINKNPIEWKKQDEYIKSLEWYEKNNIKPSFDIEKAIKTSERNNCGCNYRFDGEYMRKAIFFEIISDRNASSIWVLLPDDKVLLYHIQSYDINDAKVLDMNLDRLSNNILLPFACLLFDKNGRLIEKNNYIQQGRY